jgi:hypothetical protein
VPSLARPHDSKAAFRDRGACATRG